MDAKHQERLLLLEQKVILFGPQLALLQRDKDGKIIYDQKGKTKPIKDRFGEYVIVNTDPPKLKTTNNTMQEKKISVSEEKT